MAIPREIARLPKTMQNLIKTQCNGDWSRVTIDKFGAITVHNRPQRGAVKAPAKKAPTKKPAVTKAPATTPPPVEKVAAPSPVVEPAPAPPPKPTPPAAPKPTLPPVPVVKAVEPTPPPAPIAPQPPAASEPAPPAKPTTPRPVRPVKSQAKPRKVLPPPSTTPLPPAGMEHLKPQRVERPAPVKKAAAPRPTPTRPPTPEPTPAPVEPQVVEPVIETSVEPVTPLAEAPAPLPGNEPNQGLGPRERRSEGEAPPFPPTAHAEPAPEPKAPSKAPPAEPPHRAPWDRRGFNRTPLPPRRPTPPEHKPLPRPSLPTEDVRLFAATIAGPDVDEVVDNLNTGTDATFEAIVGASLERQEVQDTFGRKWIILPGIDDGNEDWDGADYEGGAVKVQRAVAKGLPAAAPLLFHDDVTALHGIDLDEVEAAVRHPQRVEIAPETGVKKYPILKFWRGDVLTVVGFRQPYLPKIIAAYIGGLGLHNQGNQNVSGGGGARKTAGLPKNPKALIKRLTEAGANCTEEAGGKTHKVIFRGQDLGQINTGPAATSKDIENAWQRMRRRMEAIRMREDAPMRS